MGYFEISTAVAIGIATFAIKMVRADVSATQRGVKALRAEVTRLRDAIERLQGTIVLVACARSCEQASQCRACLRSELSGQTRRR